ncbi:glycosyltransferase family 4 protein [Algoriphagus yeomjeoni]|uniref:glycosyltransferase family 4 protein n=1 Tax=Algoriphagus yeomjeoni TaxID=291403 RepID=UPI003CE4E25F
MPNKKVLLVGPLNKDAVGGRLEEMKVWARSLEDHGAHVEVFTRFNSGPFFGNIPVWESAHLVFGKRLFRNSFIKKTLLRIWGSSILKTKRDAIFTTNVWSRFVSDFDCVILFITDTSLERSIFELPLNVPVFIRYTGLLRSFESLLRDGAKLDGFNRAYIFHDKNLLKEFKPSLPFHFIDQTAIQEKKLLSIPIRPQCKIFAMIGLFMEVKQVEQVIETFIEFPDLKLLLFGKGELESSYSQLIETNKLDNVELRGFFPADEMDKMFQEFDALIINSSEETGPMTGVEAMAAGKLIISSSVGAMPGRLDNTKFITGKSNTLSSVLTEIGELSTEDISAEKHRLRKKYLKNCSNEAISRKIADLILEENTI